MHWSVQWATSGHCRWLRKFSSMYHWLRVLTSRHSIHWDTHTHPFSVRMISGIARDPLLQWFLTWDRSNPRGSVSQFQGFGGKRFQAMKKKIHDTHFIFPTTKGSMNACPTTTTTTLLPSSGVLVCLMIFSHLHSQLHSQILKRSN